MSQETSQTIITLIAIFGIVGNIIAFLFARIELRAQRKETEHLTRLTSELEHKVHRLATNLDHRIARLERVRDLITGLMHTTTALRQERRSVSEKLDLNVKQVMTFPELDALCNVINDDTLTKSKDKLFNVLSDETWRRLWVGQSYDEKHLESLLDEQVRCTRDMHQRLLILVEQLTEVEKI